jgi:small subunit ribosomal protein S6e
MKFNIAYPRTGAQKMYNIDDEHKWGKLVDRRMGNEFEGEVLGDEFKGYMFKITGGTDNDGFPMKQGILVKGRVRLILEPGMLLLFDSSTLPAMSNIFSFFFGREFLI